MASTEGAPADARVPQLEDAMIRPASFSQQFAAVLEGNQFIGFSMEDESAWTYTPDLAPALPGGAKQNQRGVAGMDVYR